MCETVNEQQCRTVQDTVNENVCETVNEQVRKPPNSSHDCRSINDQFQECNTVYDEVCESAQPSYGGSGNGGSIGSFGRGGAAGGSAAGAQSGYGAAQAPACRQVPRQECRNVPRQECRLDLINQ